MWDFCWAPCLVAKELARQQSPVALEHLDKIVGDCPYTGNVFQIAPDQKPYIALWQTSSQRNLDEARLMGRHEISRKKRNAIIRARRGSLRRLAVGTKGKSLIAKLTGEPFRLGNEIAL